jgi:hypothetical protein
MSVSRETTIWCDHEDCVEWVQCNTGSVADARREVKRGGWALRGGLDLCSVHARISKEI